MTFHASREIAASPSNSYAAFEHAARLASWWGPAGFTSTFKAFQFAPGGTWSFTMHGPDGREHANVGRRMEPIVVPANEEMVDRLSAEVRREGD
jgi:uncharacterized protein YndB with AHSA1/START domain